MYQHVDAALIRAAVHTSAILPPWPELTGESGDADRWRHWLTAAWDAPGVADAVQLASPHLAARVEEVRAGRLTQARPVQRAALSLARYMLRMTHRATPFGLFAAVAPTTFGPITRVRWGENHRTATRPDPVWLADVIGRLEALPELCERLLVVADPTYLVRGDRLVIPCQQQPPDGLTSPVELTVRHTRPVDTVMRLASSPVPLRELAAKLAADHPDTPASAIDRMLIGLVSRRFLITNLRPPMTSTAPLGHLISRLGAAGADTIPGVAPIVDALTEIRAALTAHDRAVPVQRAALRAVAGRATGIYPQCSGLQDSVGKRTEWTS